MRSSIVLATVGTFAASILAAPAAQTLDKFQLRTSLKSNQVGKDKFDGLYLGTYHTGAGFNDAVLTTVDHGIAGSFNTSIANGSFVLYDLNFELGQIQWAMLPQLNVVNEAAWQPVRINAAGINGNFEKAWWIDDAGLQWTSRPSDALEGHPEYNSFGGWLVCDWWHNTPQLFATIKGWPKPNGYPSSCAEINLVPQKV